MRNRYNITTSLVPTWIPEGYTEVDVEIVQTPKQRSFVSKYTFEENTIRIRIAEFLDSSPSQIERDEALLEVYLSGDIEYYIFSNKTLLKAVWVYDNFECYIVGPLSQAELKEMIDSIQKG